jgi:hypothetical protein
MEAEDRAEGVVVRLSRGGRMRTGLLLLAYLSLLDVLSTSAGLRLGIPEGNPLPAAVLAAHGELAMYGLKAAVTAGVVLAILALRGRYPRLPVALTAVNVILAVVVASNVAQLGM